MRRPTLIVLCLMACAGFLNPIARGATWDFCFYQLWYTPLQVYGTINCTMIEPPLFDGVATGYEHIYGHVPDWCNDLQAVYESGTLCVPKIAVPQYADDHWMLMPLAEWIEAELPAGGCQLPCVSDSLMATDLYYVIDLATWMADPRPPQGAYWIVAGRSEDLPGYLIGTTPIEFHPDAGPGEDPFSSDPYDGWMRYDGTLEITPGGPSPAPSTSWGSVKHQFQ